MLRITELILYAGVVFGKKRHKVLFHKLLLEHCSKSVDRSLQVAIYIYNRLQVPQRQSTNVTGVKNVCYVNILIMHTTNIFCIALK